MTDWNERDLAAIRDADELLIAPYRADGSPRPDVPIWVVRVGNALYIRSANGRDAAWYRNLAATHRGRIRAGGVATDVTALEADESPELIAAIQAEYHRKYDHYGEEITRGALCVAAQHAAWRLLPAS